MMNSRNFAWAGITCVVLVGCGGAGTTKLEDRVKANTGQTVQGVVPVSGTITVDGAPELGVFVYLNNADGTPNDGNPYCWSRRDGKFAFTTYNLEDGVKPGEYKLTFVWSKIKRGEPDGPDKLNDRYSDGLKSEFKLSVGNQPQKDLKYELTTK